MRGQLWQHGAAGGSLLSCGGTNEGTAPGGDDPNQQENGGQSNNGSIENNQGYDGLSPEGVYNAMLEADDYIAVATITRTYNGETATATLKAEKDDHRVRLSETYNSADGSESETFYCDLSAKHWYQQSDGIWLYTSNDYTIQDLLKNLTQSSHELLFEDDHYHEYNETAGYLAKAEALAEHFEDSSEGITYTLSMTPGEDVYTFLISGITEEITMVLELKITFQSVSVTLPEAGTPESGSPDIDDKPVQTQDPDDKPSQPTVNYPSTDIYQRLLEVDNVVINTSYKLNKVSKGNSDLIKDGHLILRNNYNVESYIDLNDRVSYRYSDGNWVLQDIDNGINWEFFLDSVGLSKDWWGFQYELFDSYSEEAGGMPLSEAAAATYRVEDALFRYDADTDTYIFTYTMSPYDYTFSISFTDTAVTIPVVG